MTTAQATLVAQTVEMWWEPGSSCLETGIKAGDYPRYGRVVAGGYGTCSTATPGRFVLLVEVAGKRYEIWTERRFRGLLGLSRLTKKVREEIEAVRPAEVEVVECVSQRGTKYYTLTDQAAAAWASRVVL